MVPSSKDAPLCFAGSSDTSSRIVLDLISAQKSDIRFFGYLLATVGAASAAPTSGPVSEQLIWAGGVGEADLSAVRVFSGDGSSGKFSPSKSAAPCLYWSPTHFHGSLSCRRHLRSFADLLAVYVARLSGFLECSQQQARSLSRGFVTMSLGAFGDTTMDGQLQLRRTARCNNYKLQSFRQRTINVGSLVAATRTTTSLPDLGRAYYANLLLQMAPVLSTLPPTSAPGPASSSAGSAVLAVSSTKSAVSFICFLPKSSSSHLHASPPPPIRIRVTHLLRISCASLL